MRPISFGPALALAALLAPPAFAAKYCDQEPVAYDKPGFADQLKKQNYGVVFVALAKKGAADRDKETELEFEGRGIIYTRENLMDLVPKKPGDVSVIKVQKKRGGLPVQENKIYVVYAKKEKDKYTYDGCSHTHEAKGFTVNDVKDELEAINKAYGVAQVKPAPGAKGAENIKPTPGVLPPSAQAPSKPVVPNPGEVKPLPPSTLIEVPLPARSNKKAEDPAKGGKPKPPPKPTGEVPTQPNPLTPPTSPVSTPGSAPAPAPAKR